MKDIFKKNSEKHLANEQQQNVNSAKSGKKFLNRFSKKKSDSAERQVHADNTQLVAESLNDTATTGSTPSTEYINNTWYALNGRIGRVQLLAYSMIWGIISTIFLIAAILTGLEPIAMINSGASESVAILPSILLLLTIPAWFYSLIILPKRRLHDSGKSGWWLLLYFLPIINLYLLFLLYLKGGDTGANKYGLPPAPYDTVELILAILVPIFSIFAFFYGSHLQMMSLEQSMSQAEIMNMDAADSEQPNEQSPQISTDSENALDQLDAETAAQVEAALDNAVNDSSFQVTYEQFLREARAKIFVDRDVDNQESSNDSTTNSSTTSDVAGDVNKEVFIEGQISQDNAAQADASN